jgi:hypothetical protein
MLAAGSIVSSQRSWVKHWLFIDHQLKHIRSSVVAHHIKIELASRYLGQIQMGVQNALFTLKRSSQHVLQRRDDGAAAPAHKLRLVGQIFIVS